MLRSGRLGFLPLLPVLLGSCGGSSDSIQNPNPGSEPEADLSAGPIEAPAALRLDSLLEMHVGVRNGGKRAAGPGWVVRVFLSTDQVIDATDIQIDQFVATRDLPSGALDRYLRHKKLDARLEPGRYYMGSILDVTGVVPETNEANNTLETPASITLEPKPPPK